MSIDWHEEIRAAKTGERYFQPKPPDGCCLKHIDLAEQILAEFDEYKAVFAEEHAEIYAAKDALIECLREMIPIFDLVDTAKKNNMTISAEAFVFKDLRERVESVLARYAPPLSDESSK